MADRRNRILKGSLSAGVYGFLGVVFYGSHPWIGGILIGLGLLRGILLVRRERQ